MRPFLNGSAVKLMQDFAHRGYATLAAVVTPHNSATITLSRPNTNGTLDDIGGPVDVLIAYGNQQAGELDVQMMQASDVVGTMYRDVESWDVRIGDRFVLPAGGWATVVVPAPVRQMGIWAVHWSADQGL